MQMYAIVCNYMQLYAIVCNSMQMYVCMYVCMDGWMDACMHACMYVCMHTHRNLVYGDCFPHDLTLSPVSTEFLPSSCASQPQWNWIERCGANQFGMGLVQSVNEGDETTNLIALLTIGLCQRDSHDSLLPQAQTCTGSRPY